MNSNGLINGYKFADLRRARIVSSRSDLHRKQKNLGFPKPAKTGERSAWWPDDEIRAWVQSRLALRDNPDNSNDDVAVALTTALEASSLLPDRTQAARAIAQGPKRLNK
jgi:predicted DNA-binding transcriptional regulator AlpA